MCIVQRCTSKGIRRQGTAFKLRNALQQVPMPCRPIPLPAQLRIVEPARHQSPSQSLLTKSAQKAPRSQTPWLRPPVFTKCQVEVSQIPEPLLMFASTCPLRVQISQGLGPFFQIELLKAGRMWHWRRGAGRRSRGRYSFSAARGHEVPTPPLPGSGKGAPREDLRTWAGTLAP